MGSRYIPLKKAHVIFATDRRLYLYSPVGDYNSKTASQHQSPGREMTKRQAEESLEEAVSTASPASKKPRVEGSLNGEDAPPNGDISVLPLHTRTNGDAQHQAANDSKQEKEGEEVDDELNTTLEEESALTSHKRQEAPTEGYTDLYLDTIDRSLLDFDFEKLCSVTLSNINVYACLVCGKYYQGRGPKSHAYFHALDVGHHVFVNMETKRVYVLPEGYEVTSKSLDDIKFVVDPRYTKEEVAKLDSEPRSSWDLGGKKYIPGRPSLGIGHLSLIADVVSDRICRAQ